MNIEKFKRDTSPKVITISHGYKVTLKPCPNRGYNAAVISGMREPGADRDVVTDRAFADHVIVQLGEGKNAITDSDKIFQYLQDEDYDQLRNELYTAATDMANFQEAKKNRVKKS